MWSKTHNTFSSVCTIAFQIGILSNLISKTTAEVIPHMYVTTALYIVISAVPEYFLKLFPPEVSHLKYTRHKARAKFFEIEDHQIMNFGCNFCTEM